MKKLIKLIIIASLLITCRVFAQSAMMTFDPTNWITSLDKLYATYDEVTSSIKRIEQNYQQMQHMIEQAKSLDWENIQWDGDFDFRDELRQAGNQVNKRLSIIRRAEDCFTRKTIKFGKTSFSYQDLMKKEGWNSMSEAFQDSSNNSYQQAMEAWVGKLTDKQKRTIMRKYGVTPTNYYRARARETMLQAQMAKVIGQAEDELANEELLNNEKRINAVMNKIMEGGTQKEIAQETALLQKLVLERMDLMKQQQADALKAQAEMDMLKDAKSAEEKTKEDIINSMTAERNYSYEANFLDAELPEAGKKDESYVTVPSL